MKKFQALFLRFVQRALPIGFLLLGCTVLHAGWVDTDLDSPTEQAEPSRYRDSTGPASSLDLLLNLQGANGRSLGGASNPRRMTADGLWGGLSGLGGSNGSGQVVDPFISPGRGGYLNNFGPALGSGSAQGAGLFGSGAIPAAAGYARSFGSIVGPTSVYSPPPVEAPKNEQAPVRRAVQAPQYSSASSPFEDFVRWMQDNRVTIIVAGLLLLGVLGFGSLASGTRH